MIRSMTGFTRETRAFEWGTLTVELSSVNHRYQEISPRLPREMASLEPLITGRLRQGVGRGKIRCSVELHWAPQFRTATLDATVLSNYHAQLAVLAKRLGMGETPSLASLLSLPGVFESPSVLGGIEDELNTALETLLKQAVENLQAMRSTEGANLLHAIEEYLIAFESLVDSLEKTWGPKRDQAVEDMRSRITNLLEGMSIEVDQNRVAQEVVILSDKWDIAEEFVRSRSHLRQFTAVLNGKSSEGRKLDFLLQEMNREINTMGSKIADAELRWMVVEAKSLLEKIREQVQNVE